jgi:hypothetical protein
MKRLIFFLPIIIFSTGILSQNLYVDSASTCTLSCTGSSWSTAFTKLQDAIGAATAGDTIFVAKGTYFPDEGVGYINNNRLQYFEIPDSVVLLGGYPNGGGTRDWILNPTILSGDIDQNGYISGNTAHIIYTAYVSDQLVVDGFTITKGYAYGTSNPARSGAGWCNIGSGSGKSSSPQVRNCTFVSNRADGGAAIYDDATSYGATSMTIENCKFLNNEADDWGGAIFFNAHHHGVITPTVKNCQFLNSSSDGAGGAVYIGNGSYSTAAPVFDSCVFDNSYSYNNGGAIFFASTTGTSNPVFINCSFFNNETNLNRGGSINFDTYLGNGRATLVNCRFSGNTASTYGGGISLNGYQGSFGADVINCIFDNNYSSWQGSACFNSSCAEVAYVNCTFSDNDGDVAVYASYSGLNLTNCILWNNQEGETGSDTNSTITISNSIISNGEYSLVWDDQLGVDGGGNRFKNPLFTNPALGDFSLSACSPAINSGKNDSLPSGIPNDILGFPRIYNNLIVDIGAVEYQGAPSYISIDTLNFMEHYSCSDTTATVMLGIFSAGGTGSIFWDNGETQNPAVNLTNIHHKVVVTNTNGCKDSLEFSIEKHFAGHIFVDSAASGDNTGCNWTNAYNRLQDALYHAKPGYSVHVAEGTYYPDLGFDVNDDDQQAIFIIPDSVTILGGYPSGGGARDPDSFPSILSGEIQQDTLYSNNSNTIVSTEGVSNQTVVDGLVITGGNAYVWYNKGQGAGVESSPVLRNCVFKDNHITYGVFYNYAYFYGVTNPSLIDCRFIDNHSSGTGILVNSSFYYTQCNPLILNCLFQGNYNSNIGGAMINYASSYGVCSPEIINCNFIDNTSGNYGGAIGNDTYSTGVCAPQITNCTFYYNSSYYIRSGSIYNDASSPVVNNCILWGTDTLEVWNGGVSTPYFRNCIVQNSGSTNWKSAFGVDGGNNIDSFPAFIDTTNFDMRLSATSPAIDAGDTTGLDIPLFDLAHNYRIAGVTIDIGCYEHGSGPYGTTTFGTDYRTECDSLVWIDGNTYTGNNTTATFTLTNSLGGDSIVTLNLTIYNSSIAVDTQHACDSLIWIDGNTYYSNNSTAIFTIPNQQGCDSVITLDLTITNSTYATDVHLACDSLLWINGTTYYSNNTSAAHILTNSSGCDSIVYLDLTINYSTTAVDSVSACNSYTWIDGITYFSDNNTATHALTTSHGCDSVVTLHLTIDTVNTGVYRSNDTLFASALNAAYQWLDCDNGAAMIPGETSRYFIATTNGNYAVEVTENNCTDTSNCLNVTGIGFESYDNTAGLRVLPNPTEAEIELFFDQHIGEAQLLVINSTGQLILRNRIGPTDHISITIPGAAGVYYIRVVEDSGNSYSVKVLKQ